MEDARSAAEAKSMFSEVRFLFLTLILVLVFATALGCGNPQKKRLKYYQKGVILSQRGRCSEAVDEFRKALDIDPGMADAYLELGRCYRSLQQYDEALEALETARRMSSDLTLPALFQIANVYVDTGGLSLAEQTALSALQVRPDSADFMLFLGKLEWKQDKPDEAVEWLKKAAAADPTKAEPWLMLAEIHMRKADYASAEENLKKVINDVDPENTSAKLALAKVFRFTDKEDQAIQLLRRVLEKEPNNVTALGALVETYYSLDRLDDARKEAETFLRVAPGNVYANSLLGAILLKQGKYSEAVVYLTKATVAPDASAKDYYLLGSALKGAGQPAQAISSFQKALTMEPNNFAARLMLAEAFLSEGSFEQARREITQVLTDDPGNDIARQLLVRANALQQTLEHMETTLTEEGMPEDTAKAVTAALNSFRSGDLQNAQQICDDLLKTKQDSPVALNLQGLIYLKQNQLGKALDTFRHAADVNPTFAASHINMANIYMAIGSYSAAAHSFEEAMKLLPKDQIVRLRYARALTLMKEEDKAETFLKDIVRKEPDTIAYRRALVDVLISQNKYEEARQELTGLLKVNSKNVEAAVLLAECYAKSGDLRRASKSFEVLSRAVPKSKYLAERLALCDFALGMPEKAREIVSPREGSEADKSAGLVRALLMQEDGRYDEAERILHELQGAAFGETPYELMIANLQFLRNHEAEPELPKTSYYSDAFKKSYVAMLKTENLSAEQLGELNLALALVRVEWRLAGLEGLQRLAAEIHPTGALLEMIGGLWEKEGQPGRAKESYEAALAAEPHYWPASYRLGLLATGNGDYEIALTSFQKVLREKPDSLNALLGLAHIYEIKNDDADALKTYRAINQLQPDLPPVLNNLAWLLAKKPDTLDQAMEFAQSAVNAQPLKAAAHDTLGWIYFQKGEFPQALEHLDRAVLLDGFNPSMRYHRGMALFKLGRTEQALKDFREAGTVSGFPEKALNEQMIKQLG